MTKQNAPKEAADKRAHEKPDPSAMDWAKSGAKSPDDFSEIERASARNPTGAERKGAGRSSNNGGKHVERR